MMQKIWYYLAIFLQTDRLYSQRDRDYYPKNLSIQYWIFHHKVIETCFEMQKSSENEKPFRRYSNYKSPNF